MFRRHRVITLQRLIHHLSLPCDNRGKSRLEWGGEWLAVIPLPLVPSTERLTAGFLQPPACSSRWSEGSWLLPAALDCPRELEAGVAADKKG